MDAYATVDDVTKLWRALTVDEQDVRLRGNQKRVWTGGNRHGSGESTSPGEQPPDPALWD